MNNEKNKDQKLVEDAWAVYNLTKTTGWKIIEEWINNRVKKCDSELEIINPSLGYEGNFLNYIANIHEKLAYKKLLNKVVEYIKICEGGEV